MLSTIFVDNIPFLFTMHNTLYDFIEWVSFKTDAFLVGYDNTHYNENHYSLDDKHVIDIISLYLELNPDIFKRPLTTECIMNFVEWLEDEYSYTFCTSTGYQIYEIQYETLTITSQFVEGFILNRRLDKLDNLLKPE